MTTRNLIISATIIAIAVLTTFKYRYFPLLNTNNEISSTDSIAAIRVIDSSSSSSPVSGSKRGRGGRRDRVIARAERHFILTLSDETFLSTPLDRMMSRYNFNFSSCDDDFGNGLVNRWRDTRRQACSSSSSSSSSSSVETHLIHQAGHAGDGDNLVLMRNVTVDLVTLPCYTHIDMDILYIIQRLFGS